MLTLEAAEEDAAVCAGRDEGEVATMAHSSNGAMWQRFLQKVRAAARNVASNKEPPYRVAWALNLTEMNVHREQLHYFVPCTTRSHGAALCARVCIQGGRDERRANRTAAVHGGAGNRFRRRGTLSDTPELASRAVLADDSLKRSDSWCKPRERTSAPKLPKTGWKAGVPEKRMGAV